MIRAVGLANAKELLYTGKRIDAREAQAKGLVNAVLPKEGLEDLARQTALEIARNAPSQGVAVESNLGAQAYPWLRS